MQLIHTHHFPLQQSTSRRSTTTGILKRRSVRPISISDPHAVICSQSESATILPHLNQQRNIFMTHLVLKWFFIIFAANPKLKITLGVTRGNLIQHRNHNLTCVIPAVSTQIKHTTSYRPAINRYTQITQCQAHNLHLFYRTITVTGIYATVPPPTVSHATVPQRAGISPVRPAARRAAHASTPHASTRAAACKEWLR